MFGTPLVCRVVPMTGRQLYDKLYRRFHRFLRLKAGGVSAASPGAGAAGASPSRQRKGGYDGSGAGGAGSAAEGFAGVQPCMGTADDRDCPRTVRATSAWVAAGEVNRWGFRLRLVESSGYACSRCRWTEGCVGCFIRPDDEPCPVRAGDSVGVDWHISVIKVRVYGGMLVASMHLSARYVFDWHNGTTRIMDGTIGRCPGWEAWIVTLSLPFELLP